VTQGTQSKSLKDYFSFVNSVMRLPGKIGMFLALSLLLLHSVIPHEHHSDMDDVLHYESHTCATSLFDLIQLSFHNNPGDHHLEEFQVTDQIVLDYFPGIGIVQYEILLRCETNNAYPVCSDRYYSRFYIASLPFRGPPSQA
jgi:hypothetical protein